MTAALVMAFERARVAALAGTGWVHYRVVVPSEPFVVMSGFK